MYLSNPGLWGPCYGYLSILICLCPCRVAARRWYAGYLCVLFSSLWVGPLSQTWLRDPVGTSRATSPLNDVTRFFKNAGRHNLDLVSFIRGRSFEEGSFLSFKPQHEASTWSEPSHAFKRSGESKEDVEKRHFCKLWWRFSFLGFEAFSHGVSSFGEDEV